MERNNCEFANIESLSGGKFFPSEMAVNSTYEYQRIERNNHTSANIEGSGRGKFGPENRVETTLSPGEFTPPPPQRIIYILRMERNNPKFVNTESLGGGFSPVKRL